MTIYEIKRRTMAELPHYFDRGTMRHFGQTLKDFRVYQVGNGCYAFRAPIRKEGRVVGETVKTFDPTTDEIF